MALQSTRAWIRVVAGTNLLVLALLVAPGAQAQTVAEIVEASLEAPGAPPGMLEAPSLRTAPPGSSRQPRSSPDHALLGRAPFCLGLAAFGVAGEASSAMPLIVAALAREGGRRRVGGSSSPKRLLPERPKEPPADEGRRESGCLASAIPGATQNCSCHEPAPKSPGTFLPPVVTGEGEV